MHHPVEISMLLAILLPLPAQVRATCYYLDGSTAPSNIYQACDPDADVSPCCALTKGSRNDICMISGLCYAQDGIHAGFIYSNGCTDQSGLSGNCPHFCPDGSSPPPPSFCMYA